MGCVYECVRRVQTDSLLVSRLVIVIRAQLCNSEVALIGPLLLGGGLVLVVDWWGRCLHPITPAILDGVTSSTALNAASISLAFILCWAADEISSRTGRRVATS